MNDDFYYKYAPLNQYTLSNLFDNTIYFNKAENFDDPIDCSFSIGATQPSLYLNTQRDELYKFSNEPYRHYTAPDFDPYRHHRLLENIFKNEVGIACLTKHQVCNKCGFPNLNPVMMSLYAARHSGIVIEYKKSKKTKIYKVNYGNSYKEFCFGAILDAIEFKQNPREVILNKHSSKPLLFKFHEWEYQNEYRIFDLPNHAKLLDHHGLCIERIFIGSRVEIGLINTLEGIAKTRGITLFMLREPFQHNDKRRIRILNQTGHDLNCKIKCKM